MPKVRLTLAEAKGNRLPQVCLRCGESARHVQTLEISWFPPWVNWLMLFGVIPYLIVSPILTKKATLRAPFCVRHRYHWYVRQNVIAMSILVWTAALYGSLGWYPPAFPVVLLVVFPALIVLITLVHRSAVRPTEVTDTHLVIDGVCEAFIVALVQSDEGLLRSDEDRKIPAPAGAIMPRDAIPVPMKSNPSSDAIEE